MKHLCKEDTEGQKLFNNLTHRTDRGNSPRFSRSVSRIGHMSRAQESIAGLAVLLEEQT